MINHLNFTVGPVMSTDEILKIGGEQVPYFRTPEFSNLMLENEDLMRKFVNAPSGSRVVFITGSGTASMETVVMHVLTSKDNVLVIDGGSFGHRFVELCDLHNIPCEVLKPEMGRPVNEEMLNQFNDKGFTALLVNIHETSTGVHYDPVLLGDFCKRNNLLFIVDAISSFLADELDMSECGANVIITGSQKVLACAPGISIVVLDEKAQDRVEMNPSKSYYLDLKSALKNGERGQTPFTPAVGILRQINRRLNQINENGGVTTEIEKLKTQAEDFRNKIKNLPFEVVSTSMSNALTPLHPTTASAYDIFIKLKDEYNIWVCPNGSSMKDTIFRIGHFGALTPKENDVLIEALKDLQKRGII